MAMSAGVYRSGRARFASSFADVVSYRDGKTASIAVIKDNIGELIISTNGKADAAIQLRPATPPTFDEVTMIMAGVLPLAMHRAPRTAGVIGFGSGLSTHTLLGDPRLSRVDTIEIEPAMVEGAKAFGTRTARVRRSQVAHRLRRRQGLLRIGSRYDIIISEPSNPWVGVACSARILRIHPEAPEPRRVARAVGPAVRDQRGTRPRSDVPSPNHSQTSASIWPTTPTRS